MQFRPCIDLHNGKVKQIVGGTLSDSGADENFISSESPAYYSRLYKKYNLTGGHVIKLGAGNDNAALEALKAWPGGLQIGGGITAENAAEYLDAGASHVIVTSYVFSNGEIRQDRLKKLVEKVGKKRLVLDLSCRKKEDTYYVVTDRWQKFTEFPVNAGNLEKLAEYCDEFLIHGVDVEGLKAGIEEPLVILLGESSPVPATYAGGVRNKEDISRIEKLGSGRVDYTVGSALDIFGGTLPFLDLVEG